jgi:hypothetical protein
MRLWLLFFLIFRRKKTTYLLWGSGSGSSTLIGPLVASVPATPLLYMLPFLSHKLYNNNQLCLFQLVRSQRSLLTWTHSTCGRPSAARGRAPGTRSYSTLVRSTVQYSIGTVQYSTVQYSTVQYSTVQCSTVQYSPVQYSAVQNRDPGTTSLNLGEIYNTVQYRYSTVQYGTV